MARQWTGKWAGGRTREIDGRASWVIERMKGGRRYNITLEVHSETDAMAELALFERNPEAYLAARASSAPELGAIPAFTSENLLRFTQDKLQNVTRPWTKELLGYLKGWMGLLKDRDLRSVTLAEYHAYLDRLGDPQRKYIIALRSYTKWLRTKGILSSAKDASRDLTVPAPKRPKIEVGYDMKAFELLFANIHAPLADRAECEGQHGGSRRDGDSGVAQSVRDVLVLRALCGMHHTEIDRLARGAWKVKKVDHGEIKGTITFIHKSGEPHRVSINAQALAAAERLQARGYAPAKRYVIRLMDEAAERAKVSRMSPGQLRHSFVTWSRTYGRLVKPVSDKGVDLAVIAEVIGHAPGSRTTKKNYDGTHVPAMIVLPIRLVEPAESTYVAQHLRVVGGR